METVEFDNVRDLGSLCICAVRYALGRRTYMASIIAGQVARLAYNLDSVDISVLIRDIENPDGGYGDDCDEKEWMMLLDRLKAVRRERERQNG